MSVAGGSPGSPDLSTSSLLSCSEHYQGESLLENLAVSPQTPSSPETPEWSLLANGESFHKVRIVGRRNVWVELVLVVFRFVSLW